MSSQLWISTERRSPRHPFCYRGRAAALRTQVKITPETLALSIGSDKDGQSSSLDVLDAQRSVAAAQASLVQAVQQTVKDHVVLNMATGCGYIVDAAIRPTSYEHCDSCRCSDRWEIDQPATRSGLINGLHV